MPRYKIVFIILSLPLS